jgi:hypothetical protein
MTAEPLPTFESVTQHRSHLVSADEVVIARKVNALDMEELSTARRVVLRQRRVAYRIRMLNDLMERRAELAGVHGPADVTVEATTWSA